MDSLKQMMPADGCWPQSDDWGMHDFTLTGAQNLASYRKLIEDSYGPADTAADWVELAQFENYDGLSRHVRGAEQEPHGPAALDEPSHVARFRVADLRLLSSSRPLRYFGSKKASEPLHIQWNPLTDKVEVVNYSAGNVQGLTANVELLNMDGSKQWEKSAPVDSVEDSVRRSDQD